MLRAAFVALCVVGAIASAGARLEVLRVVDGDTLLVRNTPTALYPKPTALVRLRGINAPETGKGQANNLCAGDVACMDCERAAGQRAASQLASLVQGSCTIADIGSDKYGRIAGRVTCNGVDVGAALVKSGHAVAYDGGKRKPWAGCAHGR